MSAKPRKWYALYLRSRYEKRVHADLTKQEIESFLPLIEEEHVWSDRKKRVRAPLFRGYLFVRTDLRDRYSILQTGGVVRFVGAGGHPSAIPDEQIDWVRIVAGHPARIKREPSLMAGDRVKVIGGPFQGITGTIARVKGSVRVVLAVDSIPQAVSVEVNPDFVVTLER
jgi:transcription antitermination factor NusG